GRGVKLYMGINAGNSRSACCPDSLDAVGARDIKGRIDLPAILADFEMHVITGGATTAADLGDGLAALHQITDLYSIALVVGVEGDVAIGVTDLNHVAITILLAGEGDDTRR